MAAEFKTLLRKLSQQLTQQDVETIAASARHCDSRSSAEAVLLSLAGRGDISATNVDSVMDAMKQIGRNDLYKEVKAFKKKSRKKLAEDPPSPPPPRENDGGYDLAEREAARVLATLQKMEDCEVVTDVDRIRELHLQAKKLAENLVRVVRRANHLSRSCTRPESRTSEPCNSPPSAPLPSSSFTSSTEASEVGLDSNFSPPTSTGFRGRLTRRLQIGSKPRSKTERTPSPKAQKKINRSMSERATLSKTPSSTTTLPLPSPPRQIFEDSDSEDDYHEYTNPDTSIPMEGRSSQTLPQQVPQRQQQQTSMHHTLARAPIPGNVFSNREKSFGVQRQNGQTKPPEPPTSAPPEDSSDSDEPYDDVIIPMFEMQSSERSDSRSKPQSLLSDGQRGVRPSCNDQSSSCSTPSSEVTTPPAVLPKPGTKGRGPTSNTPAIPIRRSSLKLSQQQATTAPAGPVHSNSLQSGMVQPSRSETTTPNQPIVDIHQQLRLKNVTGSPQSLGSSCGGSDRVSPHPVSLAKALEMSSNNSVTSDCTDSCNCTGDSGFDEYTPISAAWHRTAAPQSRPKPKSLKQHSVEQQQSYTNITILTSPTSPPPVPAHHTTISHLAPIYGSNNTTPSPPPSSDHTTISAVGPMYKCISIEEPNPDEEDDCPDYVNITQYVEPT